MPATPEPAVAPSPVLDEVVLAPAETFFVRRVPVDDSADIAAQVELALETSAPFSVNQLYFGFVQPEGAAEALVFATHRRLFSAESWDGAAAVLPAFAGLLGEAPTARKIRTWREGELLVVAGWDGASALPVTVLARRIEAATEGAVRDDLLAEVRRRIGGDATSEDFSGPMSVRVAKAGAVEFEITGGGGRRLTTRWEARDVETMDIRDKAVLAERKQVQQRDRMLWLTLLAGFGVLVLAGLLELGMVAGRTLLARQEEAVRQIAPEVEKIQTAQALGARIEEMSQRRLRPFEMLAVLNEVRPPGVQFTRSVTTGQGAIEIEAQTANADAVGAFESALRALPSIESVEVRDLRLREGVTTFMLLAAFREGSLANVTGTSEGGAR